MYNKDCAEDDNKSEISCNGGEQFSHPLIYMKIKHGQNKVKCLYCSTELPCDDNNIKCKEGDDIL